MAKQRNLNNINSETLPRIHFQQQDDVLTIKLQGDWNAHTVRFVDDELRALEETSCSKGVIALGEVLHLDTAGAWLICRLKTRLEKNNTEVFLEDVKDTWRALLDIVFKNVDRSFPPTGSKPPSKLYLFFDFLGHIVMRLVYNVLTAMHVLGAIVIGIWQKNSKQPIIRIPALVKQIDSMGVGAVPIVLLMSFIVGAIIAQQGAFQLRYFGAEIFVVDLVGILVFRELGVLLTAIMIAGRSGSAITAEIGTMKMREELDALKVIGLDPTAILILPRLVALAIVLPLLTVLADLSALLGAAVVAKVYSGISFETFISRLNDIVTLTVYAAGLIKSPFMALAIGIIASVEGLNVGASSESLGRSVTTSVVKSIFIVIVMDGFFAIFYAAISF